MATFGFCGATISCHASWDNLFNDPKILGLLLQIQGQIGNGFTPRVSDVFRVFMMDLADCKVVILGQDPYPQPNVATGRAFEVGGLTCWSQQKVNASLRNIIKLLHKNQRRMPVIQSIETVRKDISRSLFAILPPNRLFDHWERQGVLLLNTALTCNPLMPNSHARYWASFTDSVIGFICATNPAAKWLLWGRNAQNFGRRIPGNAKYQSRHPRVNGIASDDFFYENHFSKITTINWDI
jgi:uracil-DNA glycosylase